MTFLLVAAPADLVRDDFIREVKARIGRDLVVAGRTSLKLFPSPGIAMHDVALSAPPGMAGEPTARIEALEVTVALLPLVRRRLHVERLIVRRPRIELRIDGQGRRSWDFAATAAGAGRVRVAQAGLSQDTPRSMADARQPLRAGAVARDRFAVLDELTAGEVRIEQGTVRYIDERSGRAEELTAVDATLTRNSVASPIDTAGTAVWKAEQIAFSGTLGSLKTLFEDRPTRLALSAGGRPADVKFDGAVTLGAGVALDGGLSFRSPSLARFSAWLGHSLPPAAAFGAATFTARLATANAAASLSDAKLETDGVRATGALVIEAGPDRPLVKATLDVAELDLNKLVAPEGVPRRPARDALPQDGAGARHAAPGLNAPSSIEDLLKGTSGAPAAGGWSDAPIALGAFGLADIDGKLTLRRFQHKQIKAAQLVLRLGLKDRRLEVNIDDAQFYEGRGRGVITVDATAETAAAVGVSVAFENIAGQPLLKDAADIDWLAGRGRLNVGLSGRGGSERQIVETLGGKVELALADGALIGIDIPAMIRGLGQGRFRGFERVAGEKTEFSGLTASFAVAGGVAQTKDLRVTSQHVGVTGTGAVNAPQRLVDFVVRPKLVTTPGAAVDLSGLDLPVRISGPWDQPSIAADLDGVLQNSDKIVDAVKEIGRELKGKSGEEALRGARAKAKELLNQFLKK